MNVLSLNGAMRKSAVGASASSHTEKVAADLVALAEHETAEVPEGDRLGDGVHQPRGDHAIARDERHRPDQQREAREKRVPVVEMCRVSMCGDRQEADRIPRDQVIVNPGQQLRPREIDGEHRDEHAEPQEPRHRDRRQRRAPQ